MWAVDLWPSDPIETRWIHEQKQDQKLIYSCHPRIGYDKDIEMNDLQGCREAFYEHGRCNACKAVPASERLGQRECRPLVSDHKSATGLLFVQRNGQ